jgi:hypothetical protein
MLLVVQSRAERNSNDKRISPSALKRRSILEFCSGVSGGYA